MTGDDPLARVRQATPARVFQGLAHGLDSTSAYLCLRADHAAARDAVTTALDLDHPALAAIAQRYAPVIASSRASSVAEHLRRPDLGRRLSEAARAAVTVHGTPGADLQVVIGDGLSATAVHHHLPLLLPLLEEAAAARRWSFARPLAIRHARVGIINDIGDLLAPRIVVLLIGERPGLSTADSLSAYLAHRPRTGQTDGDRNLISNIHHNGTPPTDAAPRIVRLAEAMVAAGRGGPAIKETTPATGGQLTGADERR